MGVGCRNDAGQYLPGLRLGCCRATSWPGARSSLVLLLAVLTLVTGLEAVAGTTTGRATTSRRARRQSIESIPWAQMPPVDQAKVRRVLGNVSVYRRLPIYAIRSDADLYDYFVRHPEVMVRIWETMGISRVAMQAAGDREYVATDGMGTDCRLEYLFRSDRLHVIYAEGLYECPMLKKPLRGRTLVLARRRVVQDESRRSYVVTQLDLFVQVDHVGLDFLAKTLHPVVGKYADLNLVETLRFVEQLSRTAEVNPRGVRRLIGKLAGLTPQQRVELAEINDQIAQRAAQRRATLPVSHRTARPISLPQ